MENVLADGEDDLDDDQANDGHLEARGVLVVEFTGENFKEFMDNIEAFIEQFYALGNIEVVSRTAVEWL